MKFSLFIFSYYLTSSCCCTFICDNVEHYSQVQCRYNYSFVASSAPYSIHQIQNNIDKLRDGICFLFLAQDRVFLHNVVISHPTAHFRIVLSSYIFFFSMYQSLMSFLLLFLYDAREGVLNLQVYLCACVHKTKRCLCSDCAIYSRAFSP